MGLPAEISGPDCLLLALVCLALPWQWVLAAAGAAAFHELCHVLAVLALGGSLRGLRIGAKGAVLRASAMEPGQILVSTLAGPLGSLSLVWLAGRLPRLAFCGLAQGLYNLLPLPGLDGGQLLSCGAHLLLSPSWAERVCAWARWGTALGLLGLGLWGTFCLGLGLSPLVLGFAVLIRALSGKIPCKEGKLAVQ